MTKIQNIKLIIVLIILLILSLFILSRMQLFKGNKDSLSRGLIAYWRFDEAKGNVISDYSGNNNQGMSVNDPSWTQGKIGGGLNLDGQDDYAEAPLTIDWPQLTVTAWFKPTDLTGAGGMGNPRIICNSHTDIDNKGFQLRFDKGGANGWVDVGNGKDHASVGWQKQLEIGKWYFYALTYDGSRLRAYLNGSLLGSANLTGKIAKSEWPVNIGRNPVYNGDYFTGIVDEIRIYNRALSPQEITTLYNLVLQQNPENLGTDNTTKPSSEVSKVNFISIPIPLGSYTTADISSTACGIATEKEIVGKMDNTESFNDPQRYLAQLIWFGGDGHLEYKLKNPLPESSQIKTLRLFFEACSEAPGYNLNHKTDVSIYINENKISTYTIESDCGGERGKYTPEWWSTDKSQYGKPIFVEVRKDGTYIGDNYNPDWVEEKETKINFKKISDIGIDKLNLDQEFITLRIGVDKDAQNKGGLNIFGEKFGNYSKPLTLGLEYEGEKIYQPKIAEIIDNPEKYENKTIILAVHPGGWNCPSGKATLHPEGFSRSATMVYDDTGCLYGMGDILIGKILAPELHTINIPGNETIIIEGKIKLDKNKTPFITPVKDNQYQPD